MAVTEIRTLHNGAKIYECASSDIGSLPAAPADSCAVVTDSPGLLMIVDASGDWQQAPQTSRDFAGAPGRVGTLASVDAVRTCQQIAKVNVKSFGAKGDGVTDDKVAIVAALAHASENLPADVYFPPGDYGILVGGITLTLPRGSSGLTIRGAGGRLSRIKFLDDWTPGGTWVGLRIQPDADPTSDAEYLHDIVVRDIGVIDTDPVGHAWSVANGDPGTEETHGFDVKYAINVQYLNCCVWNVGDEAFDLYGCKGAVVNSCYVSGSPGAGAAGGAISAGDGCCDVTITNCVISGTIQTKSNFGIAVESVVSGMNVSDITISNNHISNVYGNGINLSPAAGSLKNIIISGNTISNCTVGIGADGTGGCNHVVISDNSVRDCARTIYVPNGTGMKYLAITGLSASNMTENCIQINGFDEIQISGCSLSGLQKQGIYVLSGNTVVANTTIDGVGLAGSIASAIQKFTSAPSMTVCNVKIINCQCDRGTQDVDNVYETNIAMSADTARSITGVKNIRGGIVNGYLQVANGAKIDGITVVNAVQSATNIIVLNNLENCMITNCKIVSPSRYGIVESGTSNYNIIIGNNVKGSLGLTTVGANSVVANNLLP